MLQFKTLFRLLISSVILVYLTSCQAKEIELGNEGIDVNCMAKFYADLRIFGDEVLEFEPFNEKMETQWMIHGQKLSWATDPIYVTPDSSRLDTVFFRRDKRNIKWDTIICNIQKAGAYTFNHNECCGGFSVSNNPISVNFNIETPSNKHFLGEYGMSSILAKYEKKAALNTHSLGLMVPNITVIELSEIEIRKDTTFGANTAYFLYDDKDTPSKDELNYKTNKIIARFVYMALSQEIVTINYNPKTGKSSISIQ
jgi:hypothetical protein